jgi:hypothetical protein
VFLAITPTTQSHLLILSRLAAVLQDAGVRRVFAERGAPEEVLGAIEKAEALMNGGQVLPRPRKDA